MRWQTHTATLIAATSVAIAPVELIDSGFLSQSWRDVISIAGLVGVVITFVAFLVGIWQLYKTSSANQAATAAAVKSLNESKERYDRYLIAQVNKFYSEARFCIGKEEWKLAAQRLDDVADLTTQFGHADAEWDDLADDLRTFADQFRRIGDAEIKFRPLKSKWRKLQARLSKKIAHHHGPFQPIQESNDAVGK